MAEKREKSRFSLTDDIRNSRLFRIGTYGVLGFVAVVMTILNVVTDKGLLTLSTGAFALLCGISIILTLVSDGLADLAKWLFALGVILMFTFFLVSGNPEGFSAIWICMLPSLGMFFFDRIRGTILCAIMFLIMVFLLWVPAGNAILLYPYTETFKFRFPILFVAFHVLAFFLETLRTNAYKEMRRLQDFYQDLSVRDQLTGLFNRQGMYAALENLKEYRHPDKIGIAMFDIDFFKNVNDTYGHITGDMVLKAIAGIIKSNLNAVVCRWGGEEFVAICTNEDVQTEDLERVADLIRDHDFSVGDKTFRLTVSIGVCIEDGSKISQIDTLIDQADRALYHAKKTGRNKIVLFEDIETQG